MARIDYKQFKSNMPTTEELRKSQSTKKYKKVYNPLKMSINPMYYNCEQCSVIKLSESEK